MTTYDHDLQQSRNRDSSAYTESSVNELSAV